jgi:alpha-tubulin suppressor-like RCC1 family protein
VQVQCGDNFTLALTAEGQVLSTGQGRHGVHGEVREDRSLFLQVGAATSPAFKTKRKWESD